ncbi:hypothetical protein O6H91_06G059200 [Diphasiastrum complanatum]|uniref:Uncharacterized protein n=1 Tax=Diphasiastrum complanatum TaxID=34168 RepID=A0ACC2DE59_DIPCM|nr:hypothetical protein O6H91_06G059200 [Diphasiastrum complanatum]
MQAATAFDQRDGLERLLHRHPHLREDPDVAPLVFAGTQSTVDILFVVQKLLLRPDLTVAVAGCFRPLLSTLVASTVLRLQHLYERKNLVTDESSITISPFMTIQWSTAIHEYAVMAFSRILELAPYLMSTILRYFKFAPPPFERLLLANASGAVPDICKDSPPLLDVLRASYRFLHLEAKVFRDMWDWSPFLDLLLWLRPKDGVDVSSEIVCDVRWCALQVLSVVLRISDATTRDIGHRICGLSEKDTFDCLIRWEEFSQEIAVEKAGMFLDYGKDNATDKIFHRESETQKTDQQSNQLPPSDSAVKWKKGAGYNRVEICGIELPARDSFHKKRDDSPRMSFLLTPTIKKNLEALVLALSQKSPILLEGALGAGKSSLIYEVARLTGNYDVIFIHLDDETDIKMLLGNYVCTEVPGKFKWQPGALTQAVCRGLWVVFEDIDRAPSEIFSALAPLLEDRKLFIPGRGEIIHAADNFRLFSTITRMKFGSTHAESNEFNHLWKRIIVDAPNDEELVAIIESRFPMLVSLSQKLLGTFNMLKDIGSQSSIHVNTLGNLSVHIERQFSTRDLMKWCQRIAKSGLIAVGRTAQTSAYKERVYVEALDIFVGAIHSSADRQLVMRAIAEQWDIPLGRVNFYDQLLKPALQVFPSSLHIGRAILASHGAQIKAGSNSVFIHTGHAMRSMEHIAMCVEQQEPALLVGETGTGKTTLVQHLARQLAVPLVVLNLSQQSDSTELLGGYKPVEAQGTCLLLLEKFSNLFALTFPSQQNADFLSRIQHFAESRKWAQLIKAFQMAVTKVAKLSESSTLNIVISPSEDIADGRRKRKRAIDKRLLDKWKKFSLDVSNAERQVEAANTSFAFSFVEGALVKALRDGHWILLDEVNLAPRETLERLSGVLEGEHGTISLTERGDINTISRSPNFRIFACMNPATDVGKRDLPMALRNRFTEFYIDEMINREDLSLFVNGYLEQLLPSPPVEEIVNFYLQAREEANTRLLDGAGQKPHYSLRSLSRALEYTKIAMPVYGFNRALYDGVCMSFLTLLDLESAPIVEQLIAVIIFKKNAASVRDWKLLSKAPPEPGPTYILVEQFWLERGVEKPFDSSLSPHNPYILTASVKQNLKNLARAVFVRRYPVLLQGPTSSGKTSLIEYLADRTGHRFVRINNHEHTDLQEYLGTYMTDLSGRLVFQDGILVEAVRKGYWIVLDELNLAPPDVLEALNRLLDDNRELFIPEIQQTIKPHPHFMLFATQNPPGLYGGRKVLSRAFRNRFMELHVDDIPENELSAILEKRCQIPPSHAAKMVDVMKDLQRHRQGSKVFAGKHGFITPRDLFRWAERHKKTGISYEDLAMSGYMLLAERLRDPLEKNVVQKTLEKHMHVELDITKLYDKFAGDLRLESLQKCLESPEAVLQFGKIVWTKSMKRLFYLVNKCYEHREPTLLVGETGCGKTTVFQLLAFALGQRLRILNCHQNTETSDFLGGYRPVRDKESILLQYHDAVKNIAATKLFCGTFQGELPSKIEEHTTLLRILKQVREEIECRQHAVIEPNTTDAAEIWSIEEKLKELHKDWQSLFVWHDGSLVEAMQEGDLFLVDEISLAEDSVLERLNSVLEPKRSLVLAEKGGPTLEEIIGHFNFHLMATMNPGGDFGKKELSPALRNRFTEIWVPSIDDMDDIKSIVTNRLMGPHLECVVEPLLQFWQWFQQFQESGRLLSLRDLLSWVSYINIAEKDIGRNAAYIHGAFLVLLDGMTFGRFTFQLF